MATARSRRHRGLRHLVGVLGMLLLLQACGATGPAVRASSDEEQLYRRLVGVLQGEARKETEFDPVILAELFREHIFQTNLTAHRAAEIQYQAIRASSRQIPNADMFRHEMAQRVNKNDPVGFLLAVGYSNLVDLGSTSERILYESLTENFKPLATRNAGSFSATYREKATIAAMIGDAISRAGMSEQTALMVLRLALNDVFGKTTLHHPQVQMVLRLAFFQQGANSGNFGASVDASIDERVKRDIEFVETLAELEARGWDDKGAVMRLLDHYFGNLAEAIHFALDNGWGANTGNASDDAQKIGQVLYDYTTQEIIAAFARTRWADSGFDPKEPATYDSTNGLVFDLLFPLDSPKRDLKFPVEDLGLAHPPSVRPGAMLFSEVKGYLGTWENVLRAIQVSGVKLESNLIASLVYLLGEEMGWGQLLLASGVDLRRAIQSADTVFGKGQGLSRFLNSTKWRKLQPVEQIAQLALALDSDCMQGYAKVTPILAVSIKADVDANRKFVQNAWNSIPAADACNLPRGGTQLFMEVFMARWAKKSPLRAVRILSRVLDEDKTEVFELLASSQFDGLSRDEFTRKYVIEDIEAKRELLETAPVDEGDETASEAADDAY